MYQIGFYISCKCACVFVNTCVWSTWTSVRSAIHLASCSEAKPILCRSNVSALFGFPLAGKCMKVGALFIFSWKERDRVNVGPTSQTYEVTHWSKIQIPTLGTVFYLFNSYIYDNVHSPDTLPVAPVQSNANQHNSSAINFTFMKLIHFEFVFTLSEMQ